MRELSGRLSIGKTLQKEDFVLPAEAKGGELADYEYKGF